MTITKYGHCCLLIEIDGKRIVTDPGAYSKNFTHLTDIDIILITHEHGDHCHTESIAALLAENPNATVVGNSSVAKLLSSHDIETSVLEGTSSATVADIDLRATDGPHEEIFETFGLVQNTGYLIAEQFFIPGDAYIVPDHDVPVLALPVAGPWCKAADAVRYGIAVKPKIALPIHDAILSDAGKQVTYGLFARELEKAGVTFTPLIDGTETTLSL
jgi:L-ascorbate metabolism protein UlaG (beta-lactamase superfamily)